MSTPETPVAPGAAPPSRPAGQKSGCSRWLAGCAIGCAGILALLFASGIAGWRWALRPTPLVSEDVLLGPAERTYLVVTADLSEPRTKSFLDAMGSSGASDATIIKRAFPLRFVFAIRDGVDPQWVGLLGLSRGSNLLRLPLILARYADNSQGIVHYRDQVIVRDTLRDARHNIVRRDVPVTLVAGSLIFGSRLETVKDAIDRVLEPRPGAPGEALVALWPRDAPAAIRAATTNEHGELPWIYGKLAADRPEAAPAELENLLGRMRGARLVADPGEARGSLVGELELLLPPHLSQDEERQILSRLSAEAESLMAAHEIRAETTVDVQAGRVRVGFNLLGVAQAMKSGSVSIGPVDLE